jgi:hypothetical protein
MSVVGLATGSFIPDVPGFCRFLTANIWELFGE